MSVLRQQRRVSLRLQRDWLNLRPLLEMYTSKSLPPHTLPNVHSQCHLQSYTFTEQSMRGELCFHGVFIWLMGRKKKEKTRGFIEAQCGPLVTGRGSAYTLQRFFSLLACCPVLCCHSVHTQSGLEICSLSVCMIFLKSAAEADGLPY